MTPEIDFRPIQTWHGRKPEGEAGRWRNGIQHTLKMLREEIERSDIDEALVETYHSRDQYKLSGQPKGSETPIRPGVQVWFKVLDMPVCLSCNKFGDWEENLKAIQLTIRSRRLERDYGCADIKEQYKGHAQLPEGKSKLITATGPQQYATLILELSKLSGLTVSDVLGDKETFLRVYKAAAKKSHPDSGLVNSSEEMMAAVSKAKVAIKEFKGW